MRTLTAIFLAAVLTSTAQAGEDCQFLNAHDLSEEDISIMLSVRPAQAALPDTRLAMQLPTPDSRAKDDVRVCLISMHISDPQRSVEAGWEPVIKQVNCETGKVMTPASQPRNKAVAG